MVSQGHVRPHIITTHRQRHQVVDARPLGVIPALAQQPLRHRTPADVAPPPVSLGDLGQRVRLAACPGPAASAGTVVPLPLAPPAGIASDLPRVGEQQPAVSTRGQRRWGQDRPPDLLWGAGRAPPPTPAGQEPQATARTAGPWQHGLHRTGRAGLRCTPRRWLRRQSTSNPTADLATEPRLRRAGRTEKRHTAVLTGELPAPGRVGPP